MEVRLVDARSRGLLTFTLPAPPPRLAFADVSGVVPGLPRLRPEHASFPDGPRIIATTRAWTVPAGELWLRCEEPSERLAVIGLSSGRSTRPGRVVGFAPPMVELTRTKVASAADEAAEQRRLVLLDPGGLTERHVRPGQYCHLRVPGGTAAFYALMSTPAERELAFLIKSAGEPGAQLAALGPGDPVEVGPPHGPGFDVDAAKGRDVLFVATGTGIAPIRAVIEEVLTHPDEFGALSLYYGVRDASFLALAADLERWRRAGIDVRICYSRAEAPEQGSSGYVQELIVADRPDMGNAAVFAAGQDALLEDLARSMAGLGGTRDWILNNI